jgi:hypothetical protein
VVSAVLHQRLSCSVVFRSLFSTVACFMFRYFYINALYKIKKIRSPPWTHFFFQNAMCPQKILWVEIIFL